MTPGELLSTVDHRPWPLPQGKWAISMRWTELLFAHWPVPASEIEPLLPTGLTVDTYNGQAWVGVVPFRMGRVQLRGWPQVPGTRLFAEANVRTYVKDRWSGQSGVFFFSLDANNPLVVMAARGWYRLPYFFARMTLRQADNGISYSSRRLFSSRPAKLRVHYKSAAPGLPLEASKQGTLDYFLTERYALFTGTGGRVVRADIHHLPWTLEPAEARFEDLSLAAAQSINLPRMSPMLQYASLLDVLAWPPAPVAARR